MLKYIHFVIFLRLTSVVDGTGNACEDIDHQACVAMAMQNANLCDEPMLAQTACPKYCNNCPTSCYSCNISSHDVSSCNTVTCGRDQVCMDETIPTRNGYRHILGCESQAMCIQNQPGTLRCCTDDLCNMPVTPSTAKPATTLSTTTVRPTTTLPTTTVRPTTTLPTTTVRPTTTLPTITVRPTTTLPTTTVRPTTTLPTTTVRPTTTLPTTTVRPTTAYTPRPTTPFLPVCPRDIILMIDQSDNVLSNKNNLRNNLADMIGLMKIGDDSDESKVALLTFDSIVHEYWNFDNGYNDKASLLQAIRSLTATPSNGKATDNSATGDYLTTHTDYFKTGNRIDIPDVVMIITGAEDPPSLPQQQAMLQKLHSLYSNVIVVGIGQISAKHRILLATFGHAEFWHQGEVLQYDFVKSDLMNFICS